MKHPILGEIAIEGGDGVAQVPYGEGKVDIRIIADEIPFDATVDIAASVVQKLILLDDKAKRVAASELTEMYNNGWNEYDEVQEDGTLMDITNPELTPEEFASKLTLNGVNIVGDILTFFYDDEGMFWGHSVVVTSMDGIAFTKTHAQIFG